MDRIDAYKALQAEPFVAPDFLEVALCQKDGSLLRYASRAMLCRSLCGSQEVVLYQGDYWPVHRDTLVVGPYIVIEAAV